MIVDGLPFGDYACIGEDGTEIPIYFDRKTVADLFGTLGAGMERFKREITKATENGCQLILIVEGSMCDVIAGAEYSTISGDTTLKKMFSLFVRYGVIPVFCNNRSEMKRYIIEVFEAVGRNWKKTSGTRADVAGSPGPLRV